MPLDATQLAELIDGQAASLRLWIRSRCDAAEDVVQEAFCRLATQEPQPDNPVAWLYQVCRNLADKQRRSDGRRSRREAVRAGLETVQRDAADPLEVAEAVAAVEGLDEDLRDVLVARIWGGLSLEEVGRLCGISTATACRRYQAALAALRAILDSTCEKHDER
jgi:RNA polymerase sigma factor (sigma-70 family)